MNKLLSIIIPIHHEGTTIVHILDSLRQTLTVPHETLIVHDDPADSTLPIIKEIQKNYSSVHSLQNQKKLGVSGAIATGLQEARGQYILFLVADDPGPIPLIDSMLKLMDEGYDLVGTTRYAHGGKSLGGQPLARNISACGNRLFQLLTAFPLSDTTSGIKMFRRELLSHINLQAGPDWTVAFELAIQARYNNFKVTEIPLISHNRCTGGHSHFKIVPRLLTYSKIFFWGLGKTWSKHLTIAQG